MKEKQKEMHRIAKRLLPQLAMLEAAGWHAAILIWDKDHPRDCTWAATGMPQELDVVAWRINETFATKMAKPEDQ
jgi:hypothetical protein